MVLVDTSIWIEGLRTNGRVDARARLDELLAADEAAWCDVIRLELWNGARGDAEKKALRYLDSLIPRLPIDERVWAEAVEVGQVARRSGLTVNVGDLIIFACARFYDVKIEHLDAHFTRLEKLPAH